MLGPLAALVLSLAASANAVSMHPAHTRRHGSIAHNVTYVPRGDSYKLVKEYAGKTFFE